MATRLHTTYNSLPLNSNFGFVFADACNSTQMLNRTIAHELAHGAFHLWHTFSSSNTYTAPQGTTNNLMDYNGTADELYKYQWDYIHNPQQGIVRWLVDDEEGEMNDNKAAVVKILDAIHDANTKQEKHCKIKVNGNAFFTHNYPLGDKKIDILITKRDAGEMSIYCGRNSCEIKPADRKSALGGVSCTTIKFSSYGDDKASTALEILVADDYADELAEYLFESRFEEVDLSDKVQWVSQYDDVIKNFCKKGCCFRTCEYILQNTIGKTAPPSDANNVAVLQNSENYNDLKPTGNFEERLSYMKDQLKQGNPIVIGVHRYSTDAPYNDSNKATRHFVLVVGMGYDDVTRKNYFSFFEVGTNPVNELTVGTNPNNRLYLDSEQKTVSGYTTMLPNGSTVHPFYTITEIRTNR